MDQSIILSAVAGCGVLLVATSFRLRLELRTRDARLHHFVGQFTSTAVGVDSDRVDGGWGDSIAQRLNRSLSHWDYVQRTKLDLVRAGLQIKPTQFFVIRLILALSVALLTWGLCSGFGSMIRMIGVPVGFVVGYMLARPFLGYRQRKRLSDFEKHFADGLDIMVGGLESGSSLTAAVELVSREMPAPLSAEFARVLRDASLGIPYESAFDAMHDRVPTDDVGMLVSAIGVQFRVGGNLAVVLRTLSETVRDRQRIRGDVKTLTAQQKMTGWLITAIPLVMVGALLMINRSYMGMIFEPGPQRYFALAGVVMMVVGNVITRRILRIEV